MGDQSSNFIMEIDIQQKQIQLQASIFMENSTVCFGGNNPEVEPGDFFTSALKKLKISTKISNASQKNLQNVSPLVMHFNKTEESFGCLTKENGEQGVHQNQMRQFGILPFQVNDDNESQGSNCQKRKSSLGLSNLKTSRVFHEKEALEENIRGTESPQRQKEVIIQNGEPISFEKSQYQQKNKARIQTQATRDTHDAQDCSIADASQRFSDKQKEQFFFCQLCWTTQLLSRHKSLTCGHEMCSGCLVNWATEVLKQPKQLRCPFSDCRNSIGLKQMKMEQSLPKNVFKNYKRHILLMSLVEKDDEAICPNWDCQQGVIKVQKMKTIKQIKRARDNSVGNQILFTPYEQPKQAICTSCGGEFCSRCLMPLHAYVNCKSWQLELLEIQNDHNYCQCHQCAKIIEKSSGCNHMTCKCGYEFCFVCGSRWRLFHLCNPFDYESHRNSNVKEGSYPKCSDYWYFILVLMMKVIWAAFSIIYVIPLLVVAEFLAQLGLAIGLILMGMTYSYAWIMYEHIKLKQIRQFLVALIVPYGVGRGIILAYRNNAFMFRIVLKLLPKLIDVVLPFNWIPFNYS